MTTSEIPDPHSHELKGSLIRQRAERDAKTAELQAIAAETNAKLSLNLNEASGEPKLRTTVQNVEHEAQDLPADIEVLSAQPNAEAHDPTVLEGEDTIEKAVEDSTAAPTVASEEEAGDSSVIQPEATEPTPQEVTEVVQNVSAEITKIDGGMGQLLDTYSAAKRRVDEAATIVAGIERRLSEPRDNKSMQEKDAVRLVRRSLEDAVSVIDDYARRIVSLRRGILSEEETKQALEASLKGGDEYARREVEETSVRMSELNRRIESAQAEFSVALQHQMSRTKRALDELAYLRSPQGMRIERDANPDRLLSQLSRGDVASPAHNQIRGSVRRINTESASIERP